RAAAVWPEPAHVGRLGADCFAGFLPRLADVQAITQLLEGRLGAALSAPFPVDGHELRPGFVAGIAIAPDDGDEAETLLHHAEAALAQAKASDRPYVYYRPELTSGIAGTLRLENRLHRALERGEFELHYQPRADARSGRLTGLEALLRWRDPEAGLVAPLRFVPVLERLGLINAAGEWAIRRALADSRRWTAVAGPLRVAVNVSAVQLREPGLGDTICSALAEAPPDGAPLDLEITESVLMSQVEVHGQMLASLRRRGVGIAIDDFGTGYSSLAYLARLPVDALKIDRSFVETLTDRPESLAIVRTVISLAQSLHLKTVAEGVETAEQAGRLAELGCDELQGFWISRPLPLDALLDWLRARTPAGV
ncbi:MAG TPA: GGDEF domain-containing phosphodiesterase, partial [Plasticicumulans sp.]|nr:GGDEF domain-containing phosphodiesterase [Plasticicumulans sp.]